LFVADNPNEEAGASVQHFIGAYGYWAIFVLMVAESACIPIPSELTMPLGGALAAGAVPGVHLSLALVITVGVVGNVVGSYIAWAVGRYGGQDAWRRLTRFAAGSDDGLARAQGWFDRYGARSVFLGRLLPVIRTFISLPAGFAKMPPIRFGLYTVAGCVPWITGLAWAGYAAGASWHRVTGLVQDAGYVVAGLAVLLIVAAVIFLVRARRRRQAAALGEPAHSEPAHNAAAHNAAAHDGAAHDETAHDETAHGELARDSNRPGSATSEPPRDRKAG
jgi:membrane protein DedA with SNARE-associated domain